MVLCFQVREASGDIMEYLRRLCNICSIKNSHYLRHGDVAVAIIEHDFIAVTLSKEIATIVMTIPVDKAIVMMFTEHFFNGRLRKEFTS